MTLPLPMCFTPGCGRPVDSYADKFCARCKAARERYREGEEEVPSEEEDSDDASPQDEGAAQGLGG